MISDNQRRDYARNIRQFLSRPGIEKAWDNDGLQTVGRLIETSVGENILARLADLIDPMCHDFGGEEGTNGEGYDFACDACGYVCDLPQPNYCPNCGARVVSE